MKEDFSAASLSPHIPFPFFSPSAFFWRGEAARLRQACGQGHRSQACRRRSPAHDAGPAGVGTTNRLFGYLLPADDTRPTRRESIGGGATRRKLARTRSSYTAVLHQFDLVDRVPTRDKILSPTRVPRARWAPPLPLKGGGGGGANCQLSSTLCRRAGDGAAVRVQTSRPCLLARTYKCCRLLVSQLVWLAAQFGAAAARKLPLPLLVRPHTCPTYLLVRVRVRPERHRAQSSGHSPLCLPSTCAPKPSRLGRLTDGDPFSPCLS